MVLQLPKIILALGRIAAFCETVGQVSVEADASELAKAYSSDGKCLAGGLVSDQLVGCGSVYGNSSGESRDEGACTVGGATHDFEEPIGDAASAKKDQLIGGRTAGRV